MRLTKKKQYEIIIQTLIGKLEKAKSKIAKDELVIEKFKKLLKEQE